VAAARKIITSVLLSSVRWLIATEIIEKNKKPVVPFFIERTELHFALK
jgi:hypothetical protein